MSNQLTARDFAKFEWVYYNDPFYPLDSGTYLMLGFNLFDINEGEAIHCSDSTPINGGTFSLPAIYCKPILRRMLDMTEEEAHEIFYLLRERKYDALNSEYDSCKEEVFEVDMWYYAFGSNRVHKCASLTDYFESRQLDVRNLIGQGLAVSRHEFPDLKYSFEREGGRHE